jgi:hypothetical protein
VFSEETVASASPQSPLSPLSNSQSPPLPNSFSVTAKYLLFEYTVNPQPSFQTDEQTQTPATTSNFDSSTPNNLSPSSLPNSDPNSPLEDARGQPLTVHHQFVVSGEPVQGQDKIKEKKSATKGVNQSCFVVHCVDHC